MTSQLIPVFNGTIDNETTLLVNARDLHSFLGVGRMFAHWVKERIAEYGFVENQDFVIACQNWQAKGRGGHNRKEYHLTLDTAKELAMVERNEKGRQIRRYFIECEKKLRNIQPVQTEQQFTAEDIILLCYVQLWMEKAQQLSKQLYPVMRELNSDYYGKLFDLAYETRHITNRTRDTLLREAAKLDPANYMVHRARSMLAQLRARQFEF
ncbi:phage antirepressor Ant [Escherichia coli]|uniref:antA/AntB antirepressor family protein n=1 Tax=Escherichia coli TaxID=562 RepID=UPI000D129A53|nr:antA/AntB antirepressor family protein [Escherichia coli]EER2725965.1 phage antirepressor Ant [Escherichia coli]EES3399587.1 phage antirepressor Ant [Escherichia coli]EET9565778.1 phage antirepressor Ant [Escherichia coli]EEU2164116.1 phage antirepressor Ant [Escherichia coli]EEU9619604.1 phage antirepressor Ant [Escherichia coli]